jgi:hypothetical protein
MMILTMAQMSINPKFVKYIPKDIEEGFLFISLPFQTAIHKCPCGCGKEVVTPITPLGWKLIKNKETVTLKPSIGNWDFPCRSHYWIIKNEIVWARNWTDTQIAANRVKDQKALRRYYNRLKHGKSQS